MMLQFNRQDCSGAPAIVENNGKQISGGEDADEEDQVLAREQIKRMMNKMQEMQRKHQQQQQQVSPMKNCGAMNVNCWQRQQGQNSNQTEGNQRKEEDERSAASHELIKRRFFEKLERRKSIGNSTTTTSANLSATTTAPTIMRNFTSKLSNLREESEYAYGFCSAPGNCEIVVAAVAATDDQSNNKDDYLNNNNNSSQLFVCDPQISLISPQPPAASLSKGSKDITCSLEKNDNALTSAARAAAAAAAAVEKEQAVDEKEEAVYLTLDWKNVQVNERMDEDEEQDQGNNKEQSESFAADQRNDSPAIGQQKQIKPLDCENNKPPQRRQQQQQAFNAAASDMHSEYKHPVPVGQQQQQQVSCSTAEQISETQVVGNGMVGRQRANGADLVILPKKSVNMSNNHQLRLLVSATPTSQPTSMRKNPNAHLMRKDDERQQRQRSSNASTSNTNRLRGRRLLRYPAAHHRPHDRSCSSSSSSSSSESSTSSSSSALTSSPSSSSSVCSSSLFYDKEEGGRVPMMLRLEQLSLSEDDLKSLISHSNCCRCSECLRQTRLSPSIPSKSSSTSTTTTTTTSQQQVAGRRCFSPEDEDRTSKKDDSSNSSSGNSSATRSLMNSLFHRGGGGGRKTPQIISSSSSRAEAKATTKSVPNLIVNSHSLLHSSSSGSSTRTRPERRPSKRASDSSSGRFWSLFAGGSSIGPSHANHGEQPPKEQQQQQLPARDQKQTSDDRDSASSAAAAKAAKSNQIYSSLASWQPKTAGYRLHLPVDRSALARPQQQQQQVAAVAELEQQTYATGKYHSCVRHKHHSHSHSHHHHHHRHHRRHQHHHHHHRQHHHERDLRRPSLTGSRGRRAHNAAAILPPQTDAMLQQGEAASGVWGQLIEINKLDGSQVIELERQPGKSWGFFVARGAINKTRGIFISRMQEESQKVGVTGLLGVGDRLLAIDEHQIGPDYDILRVNRLIGKKNKILLKVKPFKG